MIGCVFCEPVDGLCRPWFGRDLELSSSSAPLVTTIITRRRGICHNSHPSLHQLDKGLSKVVVVSVTFGHGKEGLGLRAAVTTDHGIPGGDHLVFVVTCRVILHGQEFGLCYNPGSLAITE
jgi:hypothetical protein